MRRRTAAGRPGAPSPRTTARVAFVTIIVFVLAQVVWWAVFQRDYIGRVSEWRTAEWQADARAAQAAYDAAGADAALRDLLLREQPHLTFEDGAFRIDERQLASFLDRQRSHLRMFAWEGPFFVLVILSMLGLLARSLRQERELKRSHQNFLSAVTHEFKTPVATLRLLVETAQMRDLPNDRRRDYLDRMAGEIDRLERTADHVLAAARLEQAPAAPRLEARDLREVVARRLEEMRPGLEARGARVRHVAAGGPLPVSLDEEAFALALGNLLDNAVKYSPESRKTVTVRPEEAGHLVLLHVDDEGVGVAEEERERIFDRFHRSGDESTRRAIGVGLGLHLVKSAIEAMNGWVRVGDNPSGAGSRFTVVLPRRIAPSAPADGTGTAAGRASLPEETP